MKKNNILTIALTYENKDDPLVRDIMENFLSDKGVYAVEKGDLFEKVERIEGILLQDFSYGDKVEMIEEVLREP